MAADTPDAAFGGDEADESRLGSNSRGNVEVDWSSSDNGESRRSTISYDSGSDDCGASATADSVLF